MGGDGGDTGGDGYGDEGSISKARSEMALQLGDDNIYHNIISFLFFYIMIFLTEAVNPWAQCKTVGLLFTPLSLEPLSLFILPGPSIHQPTHPTHPHIFSFRVRMESPSYSLYLGRLETGDTGTW